MVVLETILLEFKLKFSGLVLTYPSAVRLHFIKVRNSESLLRMVSNKLQSGV